jgi:hypothetical protein
LYFDGTPVEANADHDTMRPRFYVEAMQAHLAALFPNPPDPAPPAPNPTCPTPTSLRSPVSSPSPMGSQRHRTSRRVGTGSTAWGARPAVSKPAPISALGIYE